MESLGIHEYWSDPLSERYSRNLVTGDGIELACPAEPDFDGDCAVRFGDPETLFTQWLDAPPDLAGDIDSRVRDGGSDAKGLRQVCLLLATPFGHWGKLNSPQAGVAAVTGAILGSERH